MIEQEVEDGSREAEQDNQKIIFPVRQLPETGKQAEAERDQAIAQELEK